MSIEHSQQEQRKGQSKPEPPGYEQQQAGHPDYRRVAQQMHRLIGDVAGHRLIAGGMSYVDHADYDLARLESERRTAAKQAATEVN